MEFALKMLELRGQQWYKDLRMMSIFPDAMNRDEANVYLTNKLKELQHGQR
jgi:hypothetical protein